MNLKVECQGNERDLKIDLLDGRALAEVDGRRYDLRFRDLGSGEYLLIDGSLIYDCQISATTTGEETWEVCVRGNRYSVRVLDPKRLRGSHGHGSHSQGASEIVAPMPGKVVKVLVELGQRVEAGTAIVVVEAMKMQNEMKSPKEGSVTELNAVSNMAVNAGDVLAVIE